jgi:dodecin
MRWVAFLSGKPILAFYSIEQLRWLWLLHNNEKERANMAESVYSVVELVGTSDESWEKATAVAINQASKTLRDLRVARVVEQDVHIEPGKPLSYRVRLELSFKYEAET